MIRVFALLFALLISTSTLAATWQFIGKSDVSDLFMDTSSVGPRGAWTKAWFKFEYLSDEELKIGYLEKKFRSSLQLSFFNCREKTVALSQVVYYAAENGTGAIVHSIINEIAAKDFRDPIPGTMGETMMKLACNYRKPSK